MTPSREEAELRDYLGASYDRSRLVRWQEQLEQEAVAVGDEAALYRTSQAYLYNLTAFAMTQTKAPYLDAVRSAAAPGARVLDVGCGIGSDGLVLLEEGYRVEFADFENPSVAYLRWRLERRGLSAPIHDLDAGPLPSGFDLAYAFDVLEHAGDWRALLASMERAARVVCVNALETSPDETVLHRALPVRDVVAHAARRRLLAYSRWHEGRSHLLLYEARPASGLGRVVSAWRAARGARPRGRRRAAHPASAGDGGAGPRG
jgi:2-polyprenyl-3-methyl-5-hydroxy-6-metoxy-1,4-benzoquinol methylase